jgi:signal transduction histidine kinase/CHASE3 domain sensor protein
MNSKTKLFSSFLLKSIFTISLFLLIFISSISYKHTLSLAESTELVVHTYKVDVELEKILSYLKDAETGQRGFIITGDSVFLEPYHTSLKKVNSSFAELRNLMTTSKQSRNSLDSLYQLITVRYSYLNKPLNSQIPLSNNLRYQNMLEGKKAMDKIRLQVNKMIESEMFNLKEHQAKYEDEIFFTPLFTLLLLVFTLMVLVFSFWKINRDLNNFKIANASLLIMNELTAHAEEIGAFSSWQWDLEANKLIYSDNQYRLLGCEPQSFEPSVEKFLEFVHPKDKHIFAESANQVAQNNMYPPVFFRVIRTDGRVRYFKSLSKLIVDASGKKTLIGINSDVTEQHLNNLSLAERNRELEQSNKELASFNHVASHDLQEPLRIVQTYISRLDERETAGMTNKGRDYLIKIKKAVTRMRTLIDALLLFSRTNKTEKIFEKSDLNVLLENSKQDLAQIIEDKSATIQSVALPTLKVIPFQIQQLFTNLIGNSIKYSKPNVPPLIKIKCKKVFVKNPMESKTHSKKRFFKISIIDNGLGFEQQYAESIFILFQRLHHDKDYDGAGIGLSICKKIMENHSGFISAQGKPDVGAIFCLYFPV